MEITEVRIKLTSGKNEKLRAFCSITIDNDFVIRDLKVIEGAKGAFVAMPSRKLMARCPFCGGKNHYRAPFCNECGARLSPEKLALDGRRKLHADVAHPINSSCREAIQQRVLSHYQEERERAKDPSYRPVDLDEFDDDFFDEDSELMVGLEEAGRGERSSWRQSSGAAVEPREASSRRLEDTTPGEGEYAVEESEWEEDAGRDGQAGNVAFASAGSSGRPSTRDDVQPRGEAGASDGDQHAAGGAASSGRDTSFQAGEPRDRAGRRGRSRSRPRSGGRRRRGRADQRREGARPGERNRIQEKSDGGPGGDRPTGGTAGSGKSPLAVDFEDLSPERRISGRWREERKRTGSGESRFRERGAGLRDSGGIKEDRTREKRLAEADGADGEPEDNFGAGLFS